MQVRVREGIPGKAGGTSQVRKEGKVPRGSDGLKRE